MNHHPTVKQNEDTDDNDQAMTRPTLGFVHPEVPRYIQNGWSYNVHRQFFQVAFLRVEVVGVSHSGSVTIRNQDIMRGFIECMGWRADVINTYRRNLYRYSHRTRSFVKDYRVNGLAEMAGGYLLIAWDWRQIIDWLTNGWPTQNGFARADSAVGNLVLHPDAVATVDHIVRGEPNGWPEAQKQMRSMGIPPDVRKLKRRLDECEAVEVLCSVLKKHRVSIKNMD